MFALLACTESAVTYTSDVLTGIPAWEGPDTGVHVDSGRDVSGDREETGTVADPVAPALLLNEVVARNDPTWDGGDGSWPDWVEIYNASDEPIALSRVALRDRTDLPWLGGTGELRPGERYVVKADGRVDEGEDHAPFALDATGDERLILSVDGRASDRLAIGTVDRDLAWARFPDGGEWGVTIRATPDVANGSAPSDTLDPTDLVFQHDEIIPIDIQLSADAMASLRASRLSWVDGAVQFPEGSFGEVQVRLKAYVGSSRTIDQKCAFKVDLNEYQDRRWHGLEGLTLNNMVQDVTYVHEYHAFTL